MRGKTVEDTLRNFGLTQKETQIYIFLAKHGVHGGGEISKKTRTAKAVVYRTLKNLQRKGFIESTLESPTRYTAVPFETILDSNIKTKHEEARLIETAKKDLLSDWSKISKGKTESPIEKFTVIEGSAKIFSKIYQMVKQTKTQLYAISTVQGLLSADRYGVFEAVKNHPHKAKVQFQFITDLSNSDLKTIKHLKRRLRELVNLRGRNPSLGSDIFPRMIIRDKKEILFFISPKIGQSHQDQDAMCLCTNCTSLIQSFTGVFEDLWQNSIEIEKKIQEVETGKIPPKTAIIHDQQKAKKQYHETLEKAKNEIEIVTSSEGLIKLSKNTSLLEKWSKKEISIRVMAPIVTENLNETKQLLKFCEVRHIPIGYFETTIIDNQHLFQFNKPSLQNTISLEVKDYENTFYTDDSNHISKTKELLANIWRKTHVATFENVPLSATFTGTFSKSSIEYDCLERKTSFMRNMKNEKREISEDDVLAKIESEKKISEKYVGWSSTVRYFGSRAFALIDPPKSFALPKIVIGISHQEEGSSCGAENWIVVNLWQKTKSGYDFVPVAFVQDNHRLINFRKRVFKGFPVEKNIIVFSKDQIQVQVKQNIFFVGWTKPIPLLSGSVLPPSCILFEGYGEANPGMFTNATPSGRSQEYWNNSFNSFVTFFHPQSTYSGSGIEGFIERDSMLISRPTKECN